jgi:hypothetical protein
MSNRWPCGSWDENDRHFYGSSRAVRGLPLRYLLLDALRSAGGGLGVGELISLLERQGVDLGEKPSKIVSDALRWEVRRGRVTRPRRGVYAFAAAPPSTMHRVRRRAAATRRFLGAQATTAFLPLQSDYCAAEPITEDVC